MSLHNPPPGLPPGAEPATPERPRWRRTSVASLIAAAMVVVALSAYGVVSSGSTPRQASPSVAGRDQRAGTLPPATRTPTTVPTGTDPRTTTSPTGHSPTSTPTTTTVPTTPGASSSPAAGTHGPITSPPLPPPGPGFNAGQVTAVGDSVMLDYQTPLEQDIPGINVQAAVSEQWSAGEAVLQQLKSQGQLGAVVIVGLSTNGPISSADVASMMGILSGASRVVFVNIYVDRPWQDPNNAVLAAGAQQYPDTVVAGWNGLASQNPGWLYSDGTHLPIDGPGAQALANLVAAQA